MMRLLMMGTRAVDDLCMARMKRRGRGELCTGR